MKTIIRNKEIAESVADSLISAGVTAVAMERVEAGYEVEVLPKDAVIAKELFPLRKWVES